MNFVSLKDLKRDIEHWEIPADIGYVCGVPRSGVLAASLLAMHHDIPLLTMELVESGYIPPPSNCRRGTAPPRGDRILVLDDSIATGKAMGHVKNRLSEVDVDFGAVYATHSNQIGLFVRTVHPPRYFEWNLFRSVAAMSNSLVDIDGVLCHDWTGHEADPDSPDIGEYIQHLTSAKPLHLPSIVIRSLVTSRLERYRPQTEAWLARHHVKYGSLIMDPHQHPADRRRDGNVNHKIKVYSQSDATLFVESSLSQSREIREAIGRDVFCVDTMTLNPP